MVRSWMGNFRALPMGQLNEKSDHTKEALWGRQKGRKRDVQDLVIA